ncbi:hypothetical protein [Rhizosphaericola mali]|uniref:Uncharacterized protein n=1 Tax=Rhizosphaericola mali TaxID=2545455 RepID=A0A5P2FWP5_9BACT|nr:hypothetical protein [Rhizosphaericola mali]QES87327.1 hypothetical protein E0W69_001170 [Rhizosphaericola mali]
MKKMWILSILSCFLFTTQQSFGQAYDNYIINFNQDTIKDYFIAKVDMERNIMRVKEKKGGKSFDYPLDSVFCFSYYDIPWRLAERMQELPNAKFDERLFSKTWTWMDLLAKKRGHNDDEHFIYLPDTDRNSTFNLGDWGSLFGTKTTTKVTVAVKGKTRWYEYHFIYNSGYSFGMNTLHPSTAYAGTNSIMYLYNDSLGLAKVYYLDNNKYSDEAKYAVRDILKAYTSDRPDLMKDLISEYNYDYEHIHKFLKKYFSK